MLEMLRRLHTLTVIIKPSIFEALILINRLALVLELDQ